jgi:hypothetical protein
MPKFIRLVSIFLLLLPAAGSSAEVVVADDFEDESIGLPPTSPDVGDYGTLAGDIDVILGFPGRRVRVADNVTDGSGLLGYEPTQNPVGIRVAYLYRIEDTGTPTGVNAFSNEFTFFPPGTNLTLHWNPNGNFEVNFVTSDGGEDAFTAPAFHWDYGIDWPVVVEVDPAADRYRIRIMGGLIVDRPLPGEVTTFQRLYFTTNFPTTGAFQVDDVLAVPDPTALAAGAAALAALATRARSLLHPRG